MNILADTPIELREGVTVHVPVDTEGKWTVSRPDGTYLRVGADMGQLLLALQTSTTPRELARVLSDPWNVENVSQAIRAASEMEVISDGSTRVPKPYKANAHRRLAYVPPLTFQLTVLRPEKLAKRVRPGLQSIPTWIIRLLILVVPLGGLVAWATQAGAFMRALSEPVPLWVLGSVALGSFVATSLHELGHGAALTREGGSPTRLGVMLFYLTPAMFCDVSNGWLLPRNSQRVMVALAGIAVQALIGGICSFGAAATTAFGGPADMTTALVLLAASNYIAAFINLIPLVKFDGYIALMAYLDAPFLRDRALDSFRGVMSWLLFGARRPSGERAYLRLVFFGMGCAIFPVVLVVSALGLWGPVFGGMGIGGRIILAGVVGIVVWVVMRSFLRLLRFSRESGAKLPRIILGVILVATALGAVAAAPMPYRVTGGYMCTANEAFFLLDESSDLSSVEAGDTVTLRSRGVLLTRNDGTGTIGSGPWREVRAPISSFVPVSDLSDLEVPSLGLPLTGCTPDADQQMISGEAVITAGSLPMAEWLSRSYFLPVFR